MIATKSLPVNKTMAWGKLTSLHKGFKPDLKKMFDSDPGRASNFSIRTEHILYDYSRQLMTPEIKNALLELATEICLENKIKDMFNGIKINTTENRSVLHTALRNLSDDPVCVDGKDVMPEIKAVLEKIKTFSAEVLGGLRTGMPGKRIKNFVVIGIGGSYLGPEYLAEACKPYAIKGMTLRFVANVDGTDFKNKTEDLDPEKTMFVVVSKTFTTAETMKNAETAKRWMKEKLGDSPEVIRRHFIAVSTAKEKVEAFGIDTANMFGFWDWVGGRYSATSAVGGVPLSLYLGFENFHKILEGAYYMDRHFLTAPFEKNIPVMTALSDIWNIDFLGLNTRAILPYSQAYSKYAPHSQQVEMESNGKSVDIEGRPVEFSTGEVGFGEPGTNGQHSFYQLFHQGTQIIPADFIGFINPQYQLGGKTGGITHHEELMTNFFAQPDALAFGKDDLLPHKRFAGNRPSNVFLLDDQDPFSAGMLLSLLENRVAAKGFIWGINSFDQFGVELGKVLGVNMRERIKLWRSNSNDPSVFKDLNPSTKALFEAFLQKKI